jgi:predicted  nucleic acid-binding Zn-ribbon protein
MSIEQLEALLLVQEHDTTLDQLRHRRVALPERAELRARIDDLRVRDAEAAQIRAQRDGVLTEERRLDDEARTVGAHADDADKKLYSGTVTSPRELQALQADVEMLRRHRTELEDHELELMEQREALESQLGAVEALGETARLDIERLQTTIAASEHEIDAEIEVEEGARADAASGVPEAMLHDYEQRRARNRGTGAGRLVGVTCQACHLSIPSTEAERIRREAGNIVAYCDNCGAILVP